MRIWSLLAQDRKWWKTMSHAATETTGFGGPEVKSLATRATAARKQSRWNKGMITKRQKGDTEEEEEIESCPLRCGFRGIHIAKHIALKHPLHPVQYYCTACGFEHSSKYSVTNHVQKEHEVGESEVKAHILPSCVYKWDEIAGYLRTYPPGTLPNNRAARPYLKDWMGKQPEEGEDEMFIPTDDGTSEHVPRFGPEATGIHDWVGDNDQEMAERIQR